jgi:hypothetical protein
VTVPVFQIPPPQFWLEELEAVLPLTAELFSVTVPVFQIPPPSFGRKSRRQCCR